jgi:hypothetical protein
MAIGIVLFGYVFIELADLWIERSRRSSMPPVAFDLLICGVCLFLLPAVLQAPIAAMNATPLGADASTVETVMQSRLYYVSFGGLAMLFAAGLGRLWMSGRIPRSVLAGGVAVCIAAFAWASHRAAVAFAETTAASRPVAERVAGAVDRAAPAAGTCRIVVLGVQPPPEWSIYVSIDSIAKALTADPARTGRCFLASDYVTYFNLMRGSANPADASPYTPRSAGGRPIPWLRIGDMTSAYLDPPANTAAASLAGIVFLQYKDGTFADVTADVASGHLPVALR